MKRYRMHLQRRNKNTLFDVIIFEGSSFYIDGIEGNECWTISIFIFILHNSVDCFSSKKTEDKLLGITKYEV
jgi:hypothetical protein